MISKKFSIIRAFFIVVENFYSFEGIRYEVDKL